MSVTAALGIAVVALWLVLDYMLVGYWPGLSGSVMLVAGSAYLIARKHWVGLATGGFCWLAMLTGSVNAWHILMAPFGLTLAMVGCLLVDRLRRFPLSRLQGSGTLCSLAIGAGLMLWPYGVARYHGRSANLRHAVLILADLEDADLCGADLTGADLRGAGLDGANLTGADLRDVTLKGVSYDCRTRWPEGYDPRRRGAQLNTWVDCCDADESTSR